MERVVGLTGAVSMGLGSILGTGLFVSIGIAAGIAGPAVLLAVVLAAGVAACNGLSSAQLAANHPVSGGTYEYGYRYLTPALGFTAGWMFLLAKSASAATAALGASGYVLSAMGVEGPTLRTLLALCIVGTLTLLVAGGMGRSRTANVAIVAVTLAALGAFVIAGLPRALAGAAQNVGARLGFGESVDVASLLHATALMFVAYTGYGRIATLGEEIREPRTAIPRAIIITLLATMALYASVTFVAVASVGAPLLARATLEDAAPLEAVARAFGSPAAARSVALGAITAMVGVLLNLLLGLSRVVLAMARRGDLPTALARLSATGSSPRSAVFLVGFVTAALASIGSVKTTWSFSAFTVLVYYSITNLAALRLPAPDRIFPRWIPTVGLISCLTLALRVPPPIWTTGLTTIAVGLTWHTLARRAR